MIRLPAAVLALALAVPGVAGAGEGLRFAAGDRSRTLDAAALRAACGPEVVEVQDPYYGEARRYRACPLRRVLELGFGGIPPGFAEAEVLLRARDGYVRPAPGSQLLEPGGWLALADADREARGLRGFDPIDRRQLEPGPFYLVWSGDDQGDPHRTPWPYQLAAIEVVRFEERFPHTVPDHVPRDDPAWRGFAVFRRECVACHAVNREGGTVGPELNVPRSIVEYRPEAQIRAYVRNPARFRYTSMPAHLHLSDEDLDGLVAYFRAMSRAKHDPAPPPGSSPQAPP